MGGYFSTIVFYLFLFTHFLIFYEQHSVSNLGALAAFERELKQRGSGRYRLFRCVFFDNVLDRLHLFRPKKHANACVTLQATGAPFLCAGGN